jgi:hypothetical protein
MTGSILARSLAVLSYSQSDRDRHAATASDPLAPGTSIIPCQDHHDRLKLPVPLPAAGRCRHALEDPSGAGAGQAAGAVSGPNGNAGDRQPAGACALEGASSAGAIWRSLGTVRWETVRCAREVRTARSTSARICPRHVHHHVIGGHVLVQLLLGGPPAGSWYRAAGSPACR